MPLRFRALFLTAVIAALISCIVTTPGRAEQLWALTDSRDLLSFDSATPGICSSRPITGLIFPEGVIAIDSRMRPPYGRLYALTNFGRLYVISNPASGNATLVGSTGITISLIASYGMDCNPVTDRIRIISTIDQNYRVNPDLGTITGTDTQLAYAAGDPFVGISPNATAAAFTNNFPGATVTSLYVIDSSLDILALQNPPNVGALNTVGGLGVNASPENGFDISGATGIAYAVFNVNLPPVKAVLYTVNLTTGLASAVGPIGCASTVQGLSAGATGVVDVPTLSAPFSMLAIPSVTRGATRLEFAHSLADGGMLSVSDVQGRVIRSFEIRPTATGVEWDGTDAAGRRVDAGLYFARLVARDRVAMTRIAIVH
jgi:hypothetical protein